MIKKILFTLLLTASFSSYAKRVVIEVPEITVLDLILPTEFEFWGYLTFKNSWAKEFFGNDFAAKLEVKVFVGESLIGLGQFNTTTTGKIKWSMKLGF